MSSPKEKRRGAEVNSDRYFLTNKIQDGYSKGESKELRTATSVSYDVQKLTIHITGNKSTRKQYKIAQMQTKL